MKYGLSIITTLALLALSACGGESEFNWCGGWEIDPSKPLIDTHQVTSRSISLHWQQGCPKGYRENGGFISDYGYGLDVYNNKSGQYELLFAAYFISAEKSFSHILLEPNTEYKYRLYFRKNGKWHEKIANITVKTKPAGSDPPLSQALQEKAYLLPELGPNSTPQPDFGQYHFELLGQIASAGDFPLVYETQVEDESLASLIYFRPDKIKYKNTTKNKSIGGIDFYWDLFKKTTKEFIGRVDSLAWESDRDYSPYIFQGNIYLVIKYKNEIFLSSGTWSDPPRHVL